MADLSIIDKNDEQRIIKLYYDYRKSNLNNQPDQALVESINLIF